MTETPAGAGGGQMSDRMQALLSAAAEETVREQRAVSTVLAELRAQVAVLTEGVRAGASDASVERLGGVVSTVVADLRTATSLLGQRIEALSKRIDAVAADTAAPTEQAAVRLAALSSDVAAQGEIVDRMSSSLDQLAGFPGALAALQKDVAGLHDRLQPLAEVRSSIGDLGARTSLALDALKPQLDGLQAKLDAIGTVPDTERLRDSVVDALGSRLDKLTEAAERPVVGPDALKAHFGDLRAAIDSQTGDRFDEVAAALGAIENRLGQVGERVADVGDAAGGVPALSAELARLHTRIDELQALREQVDKVGAGVSALQDDSTGTALTLGLASLRDDVEHLNERFVELAPPSSEEVAGLVSQRVADRLVETLAPRIADVVLTRVSAALVTQLGEALSPRVKADTEDVVRTATADSERRVLAHVDEAVLALAEALLRRKRGGRTPEAALQELDQALVEPAPAEPVASAPVDNDGAAVERTSDDAAVDQRSDDAAVERTSEAAAVDEPAPSAPVDTGDAAVEQTSAEQEPVEDVLDRINSTDEDDDAEPYVEQPRPGITSSMAPAAPAPAPAP
ncbi:MAG: flagellar motor protein MotB, partial [Frankiales bacterium]|nr:flagellar motor protein MotB [Frankiales bacterium]